MQKYIFAQESVKNIEEDILHLAKAHWNEVESSMFGACDYKPMSEQYYLLENLDMLHIHSLRAVDNALLGYAIFTLTPCHHRQGKIVAALDSFYISPEARQGFIALKLLRIAEESLQERGVHFMQYLSPESKPCGALYKRLGAVKTETVWHKEF